MQFNLEVTKNNENLIFNLMNLKTKVQKNPFYLSQILLLHNFGFQVKKRVKQNGRFFPSKFFTLQKLHFLL